MSLYLKYRPDNFSGIYGNTEIISTLQNMLEDKKFPHAILLAGPTGCGKTTIARIIGKKLGVSEMDFIEVDSADFRGIDTIRDIRRNAQFAPMEGDIRVYLLDECHKLSNDAQNALLKILEDTPKHVYFILATTEAYKLLETIKGRTSIFEVKLLGEKELFKLLHSVVKKEQATLSKLVYAQIIQDSLGHPRNALQILEQVLIVPENARLEVAKKSAEQQSQSIELCRALIDGSGWKKIAGILKGLKKEDPESIRRHVLGYTTSVLLGRENDKVAVVIDEFKDYFYSGHFSSLVLACYTIVKG